MTPETTMTPLQSSIAAGDALQNPTPDRSARIPPQAQGASGTGGAGALESLHSKDSSLQGNCDAAGSCPMATIFAPFSPNRGITMSAVNSLLAGSPDDHPENSRYFTRIIGATPDYWHLFKINPATGVADGILEGARGFDSALAANLSKKEIVLSILVADKVHTDRLPHRLLLRLQQSCKYMRIAIDDESHVVRLTGQLPCADDARLRRVVRALFADAARLLNDEWFLIAVDSAK